MWSILNKGIDAGMDALSQLACKTANKVALSMLYEESAGLRTQARQMIEEALAATCRLLGDVDPSELRLRYEQFQTVFEHSAAGWIDEVAGWSNFLGTQCDLLHEVGLHQKSIVVIGDAMAGWDRKVLPFEKLATALDRLLSLVSEQANELTQAIDQQAGQETSSNRRSLSFVNAVCGLAVILVSINRATQKANPCDVSCAALANFGASLTHDSIEALRFG